MVESVNTLITNVCTSLSESVIFIESSEPLSSVVDSGGGCDDLAGLALLLLLVAGCDFFVEFLDFTGDVDLCTLGGLTVNVINNSFLFWLFLW
jgi:hypothetical protein